MLMNAVITATLIAAILVGTFFFVGPDRVWAAIYGPPDLGPFNLESLRRTSKPHDALLCTPGAGPASLRKDGDLPAFDETPAQLLEKLVERIKVVDKTAINVDTDLERGTVRFVTKSPTLRFPDTNQFWAVKQPDGKTGLVAYARAQVGYSDLGKNLERLERWTQTLTE